MSGLPGGQECVDASLALGQVFGFQDGDDVDGDDGACGEFSDGGDGGDGGDGDDGGDGGNDWCTAHS